MRLMARKSTTCFSQAAGLPSGPILVRATTNGLLDHVAGVLGRQAVTADCPADQRAEELVEKGLDFGGVCDGRGPRFSAHTDDTFARIHARTPSDTFLLNWPLHPYCHEPSKPGLRTHLSD